MLKNATYIEISFDVFLRMQLLYSVYL